MPIVPAHVFHPDSQGVLEKAEQSRHTRECVQRTFRGAVTTRYKPWGSQPPHQSSSWARKEPWLYGKRQATGFSASGDSKQLSQHRQGFIPRLLARDAPQRKLSKKVEWFTLIDHRPFLQFSFQGQAYQFKVLTFGLSLSPRVFTRVVGAALSLLQMSGIKILSYLDNWLICPPSLGQVVEDTQRVISHVRSLGFKVNVTKSNLEPRQQVTFVVSFER